MLPWWFQKQKVISCFSAKAMYRAIAAATHGMVRLQAFQQDLGITTPIPMSMRHDNLATIFNYKKLAFYQRTKQIKIDYHFIHNKILTGVVLTPHMSSSNQLPDIFTKEPHWCVDPSLAYLIYILQL